MKIYLIIVFGLVVSSEVASASSVTALADILNGVAHAASTGDLPAAERLFVRSPTITDNFAPFYWQGTRAVARWWNAFGSYSQQAGLTNVDVSLLPALVSDVTSDRAYFVLPGVISGSIQGKLFRMTGRNTAVLNHTPSGWRIAVWTWSDDAH